MMNKFEVLRDVQEKKNYWDFSPSKFCKGTISEHMDTADYTLRGLEDIFCLERKWSTGEIAGNVYTKQFVNELRRMESFKHRFVICEFTMSDLYSFPYGSGIPQKFWGKLKVNSGGLVKRIFELQIEYNCPFIFAGTKGKEVALTIIKQMAEMYEEKIN